MSPRHSLRASAFTLLLVAILARTLGAAPAPPKVAPAKAAVPSASRGPALALALFAGPELGMDSVLRGGEAGLSAGLSACGLRASALARVRYDASLGAFIGWAGLSAGLGGGLELSVGGELPLAPLALAAASGRLELEPAPWPASFALAAPLGRLWHRPESGLELDAEAALSYSAYRVLSAAQAASAAGLAGFAAGFRARVGLRLAWEPRRRRPKPVPSP